MKAVRISLAVGIGVMLPVAAGARAQAGAPPGALHRQRCVFGTPKGARCRLIVMGGFTGQLRPAPAYFSIGNPRAIQPGPILLPSMPSPTAITWT